MDQFNIPMRFQKSAASWVLLFALLLVAFVSFFKLSQSLRGVAALVVLFAAYILYQHFHLKRLRQQLGRQATSLATLQARSEELQFLATIDPLTGVYNRRVTDERYIAEVTRSQRHNHHFSIIMLDLNDFKQINDTYGHAAGDTVLKAFADCLRKATRGSDIIARVGGDEFLLLLPECHPGQADQVLARLKSLRADLHGQEISFTFSAGWADLEPGESPESLHERADRMLYHDKRLHKKQTYSMAQEA